MTGADPKHVDGALTAAGETVDEIASESPTGQDLPHGWSWTKGSVQSGGQAYVRPIRHVDGRAGMYRELRAPSDRDRARFRRELSILSERVSHRSVLRLWDWSADAANPWYISEQGSPFNQWWKGAKRRHREAPALLVDKAVGCVREIASALGACHEQGVVHRDVKAMNIVMKRGVPQPWPILIDFGIAHEAGQPRLTPADEAVGNRRFSPDVMRSRLEDVTPWLDMFSVGQLLMWMLDEGAAKAHWERPLHWRYARYDARLDDDTELSIRAFTAACSSEIVGPRNGKECVELLDSLCPGPREARPHRRGTGRTVARAKSRGTAKKLLVEARLDEEIEAAAPRARAVYQELRQIVREVHSEVRVEEPTAEILLDRPFKYCFPGATDLCWVRVGPPDVGIQLRLKSKVVPQSEVWPQEASNTGFWRRRLAENAICFTFAIEGGVVEAHSTEYLNGRLLSILRNGGIVLHRLSAALEPGESSDLGGGVEGPPVSASMQDVREFMHSILTEERYWEYVMAVHGAR